MAANLLLLLPFALGLRLAGWSWRRTVLTAAVVSFTIELLQYLAVPGRDASLSDVLTNTTSGALGASLGGALPGLVAPPAAKARRLLAAALAVPLLLLSASAWLLAPEPVRGPMLSGWAHEVPWPDAFGGRVSTVRVNGEAMPRGGAVPGSIRMPQRLERGVVSLEADVVTGEAPSYRQWIYSLRTPSYTVLWLSQKGRTAIMALPARASRLRFYAPTLSVPHGLPAEPGITVHLAADARDGIVTMRSSYGSLTRSATLPITPAYGWILIMPFQLPLGGAALWVSALCLGLLFAPAGYWAACAGATARSAGAVFGGVAAALVLLPAATGFPPSPGAEWAAALGGAGLAWALRAAMANLQTRCVSPSASESSSS